MGRFIPPDHSLGDERTIGGYAAVHARPAALEGTDGMSYSLEIMVDRHDDPAKPFGAYLMFLQWKRMGEQGIAGHLETGFLATAPSIEEARAAVAALSLDEAQRQLDALVGAREGGEPERRWWDVMRDESSA